MTPRLPSQRGLSTPGALRRLSAVLHIFECAQMPWGTMKRAAKPSPKSSFRASLKRQSARANCTSLPPARALITSDGKGVVKWCHVTSASLNDGVHRYLEPGYAARHGAPWSEASRLWSYRAKRGVPGQLHFRGDFSIYLSARTSGEIWALMETAR